MFGYETTKIFAELVGIQTRPTHFENIAFKVNALTFQPTRIDTELFRVTKKLGTIFGIITFFLTIKERKSAILKKMTPVAIYRSLI